jgi:PAS domain S-box-containing protein
MSNSNDSELNRLKQSITFLEKEYKNLQRKLQLVEEENEISRKNYFTVISTLEKKIAFLMQQNKELVKISEANDELQIMLDSSPALIFYKDVNQRYVRVNKQFSIVLGVPVKKIIGRTFKELFPKSSDELIKDDLEVVKTGKALVNITRRVKTRLGWRHILINKVPYRDIKGKIMGIIGFALDITDYKNIVKT